MERRMKKPNIAGDSRGSAMLTVIIAMLFVIILGVSLLFAAYSGYMVKITQRADTKNFYTASAALDDIRDGLQQKVGDAVKVAYTNTLAAKPDVGTEDYQTYDAQTVFQTEFYKQISAIKTGSDNTTSLIAKVSDNTYQYYPAALQSLIKDTASTYTLNDSNSTGTAELPADGKSFTLKDIKVKCVNAKNYESTVSADITIRLPEFTVGSRASAAIGTTVIVASKGVEKNIGIHTVSGGDVYVGGGTTRGNIAVSNNGTKLDFKNCTVTCTGDVKVDGGGELNFTPGTNANSPLWARNIILTSPDSEADSTSSKAELGGRINVANDLLLSGSRSSVKLSGSYYGFGNGSSANESSAIVVNGKTCSMDLTGLSTLSIAGVSFINTGTSLRTGQSVATKPDQLAYLVPASCLQLKNNDHKLVYTTNPLVLKKSGNAYTKLTDNEIEGLVNYNKALWTTNAGTEKTLSSYNITSTNQIKLVYPQGNGLGYVFMVFPNQTDANAYYADYYKYGSFNGVSAPDYLQQYLTLTGSAATYATAGSAYAGSTVSLVPASAAISAGSEWSTITAATTDPYSDYVDRANLSKLLTNIRYSFKTTSGDSIAVVTNNATVFNEDKTVKTQGDPYVFNSTVTDSAKIHLIVASGDVTIKTDFTGTVICDGTVTIGADVTAKINTELADATYADLSDSIPVKDGNKLTTYVRAFTASRQASSDAWALKDLVIYENWKKY